MPVPLKSTEFAPVPVPLIVPAFVTAAGASDDGGATADRATGIRHGERGGLDAKGAASDGAAEVVSYGGGPHLLLGCQCC